MALRIEKKWSMKEVQEHFSAWRAQRPKPRKIPEELWQEAIRLLSAYSVNKVAKALRLEHKGLRQKAVEAGVKVPKRARGIKTAPSFMETSVGEMTKAATGMGVSMGLQIVLKKADGLEMVISGAGLEASALQGVVASFCKGGR